MQIDRGLKGFYSSLTRELKKKGRELPEGITESAIRRSAGNAGLVAMTLGLDVPLDIADGMYIICAICAVVASKHEHNRDDELTVNGLVVCTFAMSL